MKRKSRLIIVYFMLAILLVSLITTIALIFAQQKQDVSTQFKIKYLTTRNVDARVEKVVNVDGVQVDSETLIIDSENEETKTPHAWLSYENATSRIEMWLAVINTSSLVDNSQLFVRVAMNDGSQSKLTKEFTYDTNPYPVYEEYSEVNLCVFRNQVVYLHIVVDIVLTSGVDEIMAVGLYSTDSEHIDEYQDFYTSTVAATGSYPQDYVGHELNETLKNTTLTPTGKTYTTDINGTIVNMPEYYYTIPNDGRVFTLAKLENAKPLGGSNNSAFSTGEYIQEGETYFFRVQPILLNSVGFQNASTKKVNYVSKNILFSGPFNTISNSSWEDSYIRNYLNNTFLQESSINTTDRPLQQVTLSNGTDIGSNVQHNNTSDYVWIPGKNDFTFWINNHWSEFLLKECSDMALATYTYMNESSCHLWTRSAYSNSYIYILERDGKTFSDYDSRTYNIGISFMFAM